MATIDAPLLAVAERYNRVMERMKKNPSLLTDAGCIKIVSPWFIGPDGQKIQTGTDDAYRQWEEDVESADDEASDPKLETGPAAPSSLLVPFKYNECQRLLDNAQKMMRAWGDGVYIDILKARRQGITHKLLADCLGLMCTSSGIQSIIVAHEAGATLKILRIFREMIRSLPSWMNIDTPTRNAQNISVESELWGIYQSTARAVWESKIADVRSDGAIWILKDECAFYQNHDGVEAALSATPQGSPLMSSYNVSTGNGNDPMFSPHFIDGWNSQGRKNYWQRGVRLRHHPSLSIFFPWYLDTTQCTLRLHPSVTVDQLFATLDDYEVRLYKEHLREFWLSKKLPPDITRLRIAEQLNWRRFKIRWNPESWPTRPCGDSYRNLAIFSKEYPLTPEEALHSDEASLLLGDHIEWIRSTVSLPLLQCEIDDEGEIKQEDTSLYAPEGRFQIYKRREDVTGPVLAFFDGAPGIAGYSGGSINWERDFFAMVVVERITDPDTGEPKYIQIGQYRSQLSNVKTSLDSWKFMKYWNKGRKRNRWAYFGGFILYGEDTYTFFMDNGYPPDKLFRRRSADKVVINDMGQWGLSETKDGNIRAAQHLLGYVERKRVVFRSQELLEEASNYQDKGNGVCEAQHKNKGGKSSKDDLIKAMSGLLYTIESWNYERVFASMTASSERAANEQWDKDIRGNGPKTPQQMKDEALRQMRMTGKTSDDNGEFFGALSEVDPDIDK